MSTHSNIIVHRADGTWKRVYCQFDGYLEHHGPILLGHYGTQETAERLVQPGDMSHLDVRCDGAPGHSYDNPVKGQTVYYGRDRGEEDTEGQVGESYSSIAHDLENHVYVWDDGAWWTRSGDKFEKLADRVKEHGGG